MIWKAYCSKCRKVIFFSPDLEMTRKKAGDHAIAKIHMVKVGYQAAEDPEVNELSGAFFPIWEVDPEKMGHLLYSFSHGPSQERFLDFLAYEDYREDVFDGYMKAIEGGKEIFEPL